VITALRIRNFKCLADTGRLDVRPLTFLVGPNSSGKTSILQSLLLLRQTVESRDLRNPLSINGPYVQLGSYPDLLFMHDSKARLQLEIEFPPSLGRWIPIGLGHEARHRTYDQINFDIEFGYNKKTMQVFLQTARFRISPDGYEQEIGRIKGSKYQIQVRRTGEPIQNGSKPFPVVIEKFYAVRMGLASATPRNVLFRREQSLFANQMAREVEELFRSLFYIGPLREWPKRIYIATGEAPQDVGLKGELSVDVLWVQARRKATREKLLGKVNHWMREFGFAMKVGLRRIGGNNYSVMFQDPNTQLTVNLADVGFGASQVFPIVVEGFYARDRAMLLIEQPEIHLHPRAQAKLGDLLIDVAMSGNGKTLLIETHSEHLLSRVRRRVAEQKIRKEDVAIYYCEPTSHGTDVKRIQVNDLGQYEGPGLPPAFFEEGYTEAAEHFKALADRVNG
jgi:AAA15 family ATPase/GTPase